MGYTFYSPVKMLDTPLRQITAMRCRQPLSSHSSLRLIVSRTINPRSLSTSACIAASVYLYISVCSDYTSAFYRDFRMKRGRLFYSFKYLKKVYAVYSVWS